MTKIGSYVHGKQNMEGMEVAARQVLGYPKRPDWTFNGVTYTTLSEVEKFGDLPIPGLVLFKEILADVEENGIEGASLEHKKTFQLCYACALDSDDDDTIALGRSMSELEHPDTPNAFYFPDIPQLRAALEDPAARAMCTSPTALDALDEHVRESGPLPSDWYPPGLGE